MAEFLSREREFRKLNEQLDDEFKKATLNRIEKIHETTGAHKSPRSMSQRSNVIGHDRFATYTKSKGQGSGVIKKNGGGDYVSPPKSPTPKTRKERYCNGFNKNTLKALPPGCDIFTRTSFSRKQRQPRTEEESFRGTATIVRLNQINSARKTENTETPVVVQYQNDKFSCSPSLDNLIKESLEKLEETNEEVEEVGDTITSNSNRKGSQKEMPHILESKNNEGKNVKKFVNANALVRFLKAKVTLLEDNQVRSMQDMAEQKEALETTAERLKSMQQQRDKAVLRNSILSEQIEKLTGQLAEANRHTKELSQETTTQQKELEILKREMKQLTLSHKNLEARHQRTKEELDAALQSQISLRNSERELKENIRRDNDNKNSEIKYLKKQRSDLFTAYKRQLYLIDNLRQQNICMEQAKMIDFSEKEFSKVLDWNIRT